VSSNIEGKVFTGTEKNMQIVFIPGENYLSRADQKSGFRRVFLLIFWLPGAVMVQLSEDLENISQKHQDLLF